MNADALELVEIIRKEVVVFESLLEKLTEERSALVSQDLEGLQGALSTQASLVERSRELETARVAASDKLAETLGATEDTVTLRQLIEKVQGPEAATLAEVREQLLALKDKIECVNQHNTLLVKQSMKYVDKNIQILTGEGPASGVYGQSGKVAPKSGSPRAVLNQVI